MFTYLYIYNLSMTDSYMKYINSIMISKLMVEDDRQQEII